MLLLARCKLLVGVCCVKHAGHYVLVVGCCVCCYLSLLSVVCWLLFVACCSLGVVGCV